MQPPRDGARQERTSPGRDSGAVDRSGTGGLACGCIERIEVTASDACFGSAAHGKRRTHRYTLWRRWDERPLLLAILLNPSTADERVLDPTLRRVRGFAERWGHGGFVVGNAFALRTTYPADVIARARAPRGRLGATGRENDAHLRALVALPSVSRIVLGWGGNLAEPSLRFRQSELRAMLGRSDALSLRVLKDGSPEHPLYVPYAIEPRPFVWR